MALHNLDLTLPLIDPKTGLATEHFKEWVFINRRDKANRIEDGTEDNVMTIDSDGNPKDSGSTLAVGDIADWVSGTSNRITVTDDGDGTITLTIPDTPQLVGLLLSGLTASKLLGTDVSKNLVSKDIYDFIAGTANRVTVTDNGDGTVTITLPDTINITGALLSGLTASRMVGSDGSKNLVSIDMSSFLSGTSEEITVTDDGDGTATLSIPGTFLQSIICHSGAVIVHNDEVVIL